MDEKDCTFKKEINDAPNSFLGVRCTNCKIRKDGMYPGCRELQDFELCPLKTMNKKDLGNGFHLEFFPNKNNIAIQLFKDGKYKDAKIWVFDKIK